MDYKLFEKNGYLKIKNYIDNDEYLYLKKNILSFVNKLNINDIKINKNNNFNILRTLKKTVINKRYSSRDGDDGLIDIWNIKYSLTDKSNIIINNLNNNIKNIIENSFKVKYKFINNNIYLNNSVVKTRGIHADSDKYPSRVKYFLYLTDINDIYDGPFSYIKFSHKKIGLNYHRKYNIYKPLTQDDNDNYIIFSPKESDILIACVSGAHRGMPQKKGRKRIVLVGTFDPIN